MIPPKKTNQTIPKRRHRGGVEKKLGGCLHEATLGLPKVVKIAPKKIGQLMTGQPTHLP